MIVEIPKSFATCFASIYKSRPALKVMHDYVVRITNKTFLVRGCRAIRGGVLRVLAARAARGACGARAPAEAEAGPFPG